MIDTFCKEICLTEIICLQKGKNQAFRPIPKPTDASLYLIVFLRFHVYTYKATQNATGEVHKKAISFEPLFSDILASLFTSLGVFKYKMDLCERRPDTNEKDINKIESQR